MIRALTESSCSLESISNGCFPGFVFMQVLAPARQVAAEIAAYLLLPLYAYMCP